MIRKIIMTNEKKSSNMNSNENVNNEMPPKYKTWQCWGAGDKSGSLEAGPF